MSRREGPLGNPWGPGSWPTGAGSGKRQQGVAGRACPFSAQARLEIKSNQQTHRRSNPILVEGSKDSPVCQISPTSPIFSHPAHSTPLTYHQTKHSPSPCLLSSRCKSLVWPVLFCPPLFSWSLFSALALHRLPPSHTCKHYRQQTCVRSLASTVSCSSLWRWAFTASLSALLRC